MSKIVRCALGTGVIALAAVACASSVRPGATAASAGPSPSDAAEAVYIAPAVERMAQDAAVDVRELVTSTVARIAVELPGDTAQVVIKADPKGRSEVVISEIGLGGQVRWPSRRVELFVDTEFDGDATELFERWLPSVLAHELHHHRRYGAVDRPVHTLLDNLVTDGLAIAFVDEVISDAPPTPWADALTAEQEARWWRRAQAHLTDPFTAEDFERWFFGREGVPRWTGYTLGAKLVRAYLEEAGTTAAEAVGVDARRLLEESPYDP